ncbi:MAG: folate-binding protein [Burkholderiales bacterium]|nr:MAG: folate-binding protein [Burkholderiales bacterium]
MSEVAPPENLPKDFDAPAVSGCTRLDHLGVIRVEGADAVKFLQGQLTQDFVLLQPGQSRLAAFCSAKGRMQASFIALKRSEQEVLLLCAADLLAQTVRRLGMFVLRAQARLSDDTARWRLWGLAGSSIPADLSQTPWSASEAFEGAVIRLYPAAGVSRALLLSPADAPEPATGLLAEGLWDWLDVRSGIAMVCQATHEAFVPQMLNYESVGGVSFKKGCYPGQEVVARSQFRGTLKRRAFLVQGQASMAPGQEVFHAADPGQPCGTVAAAAARPGGGFDAIVSMQVAAASGGLLRLGSADGPVLELLPLPYPLLEDI